MKEITLPLTCNQLCYVLLGLSIIGFFYGLIFNNLLVLVIGSVGITIAVIFGVIWFFVFVVEIKCRCDKK